jgi:quercetin dioxygenase-like cupin family protein
MARHDRYLELAALGALDLLDESDAAALERHRQKGCPECEAEAARYRDVPAALGLSVSHPEPPADLRNRLMARIATGPQVWKSWDGSAEPPLHVVRQDEGEWQTVKDGVYAKRLYVDAAHDRVTMLVRMDPGASYIPHRHAGPEQCFVLEGDIRDSEHVFRAGDFQCASRDSDHEAQWTEDGCLLLIVSSMHDRLLA